MALDPTQVAAAFPEFAPITPIRAGSFKLAVRGQDAGREVVIKLPMQPLPDDSTDEEEQEVEALLGERFRREIEGMRRVHSDRVVPILRGPEVRTIGGREYLWYLEPHYPATLEARMGPRWALPDAIALIADLIDGIAALWSEGLVHRDIKPSNIGIDGTERPVLLDLGAALFTTLTTVTQAHEVAPHTPRFAAPEQLVPRRHGTIDFRTDLFPVGIIGYQLVVGQHPFGLPDARYVDRLRAGTFDRNALAAHGASPAQRALLERLLYPAPGGRYRTIAQARAAVATCR